MTASADNATARDPSKRGIGIIIGLVVGIVLVLIAVLALIIFFVRRKGKSMQPKPNPSASGRVREDAESMDGKTEADGQSFKESLAEEARAGGRLRYMEPDDGLPSGRLQHN